MLRAFSGGSSPQTSSISVSAGTTSFGSDEEIGEDGALLRSAEGDRAAARVDLERSEDAELQRRPVHPQRRRWVRAL